MKQTTIKPMTTKELSTLIGTLATGDFTSAKELSNTKRLPSITEAQAEQLASLTMVEPYTFEDFYPNPFTREWSLSAHTTSGYAYGEEVQGEARDTLEEAGSIGAYLNNFLASMHYGLDPQSKGYAESALDLMKLATPLLETFLKDVAEWEKKQFCLAENVQAVADKLAQREHRRNQYAELTQLELMVMMMNKTDEGVKAELQAEAMRRIEADKAPTLTNPTNTIRGDLESMSKHYSGDLGGQRHAPDAVAASEPKPFNNREMDYPVTPMEHNA
ncbi:hypothetical protein ABMX64_05360 [Vibrio vulnificus]|uniref:hypothetical protein n=1 Tax=Vibrio vulnificus TaxID=672 RepID=UPI0021D7E45A|nr:hypothetical protein [Vibrio vulnificus]